MPKVKQVTARKDYPQFGIEKGQKHYHWSLKTGPSSSREYRQIEPPRPSQLTTSEFLGTIRDIELEFDAMAHDDGLPDTLREIADRIGTLGQEQQDKLDNMSSYGGLESSPAGELLGERAQGCEDWKDEIESAADTLEEKLDEIEKKDWNELDEFSHHDPEDEDFDEANKPTDDEIDAARDGERATAYEEAMETATSANPGF